MSWRDYISSPPPDTVWHLDETMAMVVHRDRKGEDRCAAGDLPAGVFETGTAGIQTVDVDRLTKVLTRMQSEVAGSRRAAIVVPTAWVRTFLVDLEELPRRQKDLDEVLRWRLKKILSVPAKDLRLAAVVQPAHGGKQHVLCAVALEKALVQLETAFSGIDVAPSLIVSRVLALSLEPTETTPLRLFVQQERSLLSILLMAENGVRLVRTKLLPSDSGSWDGIGREIALAISFIRMQLGFEQPIAAIVSALDSEAASKLMSCIGEHAQVEVHEAAVGRLCGDSGFVDRLGRFRVAPVAAVLRGGRP